jgi:hypothetical protein
MTMFSLLVYHRHKNILILTQQRKGVSRVAGENFNIVRMNKDFLIKDNV